MTMEIAEKHKPFISVLKQSVNDSEKVTDNEMKAVAKSLGMRVPWKSFSEYNIDGTVFCLCDHFQFVSEVVDISNLPKIEPVRRKAPKKVAEKTPQQKVEEAIFEDIEKPAGYFIPQVNKNFKRFGKMGVVNKIIKSGKFCPTYIFGETGLGKSLSVNQLAARAKKEVIRINVNAQTCEEDFIGGFRLQNGETVWEDGPLVIAMKRGAILLVDEITALNPAYAFMLFGALEGESIYIKKTNEMVEPKEGFNIIATDNTRGYGTATGRWVGVNVQNEAFLDRFLVSVEYDYPTPNTELGMLSCFNSSEEAKKEVIKWANFVRNTYKEGAIDVTISPRKVVSILQINEVFCNLKESIGHAIARYESDVADSLLDFFEKISLDPAYAGSDMFDNEIK